MRSEDDKAKDEIKVFYQFARAASLQIDDGTIKKCLPKDGEPDIYCEINGLGRYFELTEACTPEIAESITASMKGKPQKSAWVADISELKLREKIVKTYSVSTPVELVVYLNDRTVLPASVIAEKFEIILANGMGPFQRVWLFDNELWNWKSENYRDE